MKDDTGPATAIKDFVRWAITHVAIAYVVYLLALLLVSGLLFYVRQPSAGRRRRSPAPDASVGFLNGVLGGMTGLAGILVTIWCGLRGWPKDVQRTVFQPVAVAIFLMSALWIGGQGRHHAWTPIKLFLIGLPALLAGTWLGLKLFGRARRGCVPQGRAGAAAGVG